MNKLLRKLKYAFADRMLETGSAYQDRLASWSGPYPHFWTEAQTNKELWDFIKEALQDAYELGKKHGAASKEEST